MTYKLPDGWKEVKLGDVTHKIGSGSTPRGGSKVYLEQGTTFIRSQNVLDYGFSKDGLVYISSEHSDELKNVEVLETDVLLNITGDSVARACIPPKEILPARVNQHVSIIRGDEQVIDNEYILYKLQNCKKQLISFADSGGTRKALTKSMIEDLDVILPPLKEQKAIADTLSALDDKIELNNKINKNLEAQVQAIFKHWFIDFEFPDENGNPYKSSGGEMVESELGMIPKGWEAVTIRDISKDIVLGKTPRTSVKENFGGDIPFLTIPDMHGKVYVDNTERTLSEKGIRSQPNKTVPENSICVSCIATPGLVVITRQPTQTNQQINTIIPLIEYSYVYSYMKSISGKIVALGAGGTTTNNLNKTQFSNMDVILASKLIREKYHSATKGMLDLIKNNQQQNQILSQLRDTLLPKLMGGEIRIPLDE